MTPPGPPAGMIRMIPLHFRVSALCQLELDMIGSTSTTNRDFDVESRILPSKCGELFYFKTIKADLENIQPPVPVSESVKFV